ncbi:unnamed protein product [Danaus chrysippus]|uniref:(African queen) hypothetical protein n=1 Tax=Danaus chrysippus TaxID=151541 RepID=A0A8J2R3S6_9NEOP|nr:unnamed protein product [Danaus chrysippus]
MSGPVQRSADVWRRAGDAQPALSCSRVPHSVRGGRSPDRAALRQERAAPRATLAPGLFSRSQVPEVARGASARKDVVEERRSRIVAAARPLYFIRCSGDNGSRRLLEYTYRVGGCRRVVTGVRTWWPGQGVKVSGPRRQRR